MVWLYFSVCSCASERKESGSELGYSVGSVRAKEFDRRGLVEVGLMEGSKGVLLGQRARATEIEANGIR